LKKRLIIISLLLVTILALTIPVSAMAAAPNSTVARTFSVVMTPASIDDTVLGAEWPVRNAAATNVWPIVNVTMVNNTPTPEITGWVIDGRSIRGTTTGNIAGSFSFTYGGVLDELQSGSVQGIIALQTNPMSKVYLAATGDCDAQVVNYYVFAEIQRWCDAVGAPVGYFFSQIYSTPSLIDVPELYLEQMYTLGQLPALPKTLSAVFSGTAVINAGTGDFADAKGTAKFDGVNGKALTLNVYPNQHVYKLDGAIKMTGVYGKQTRRTPVIDKEKLKTMIDNIKARLNK